MNKKYCLLLTAFVVICVYSQANAAYLLWETLEGASYSEAQRSGSFTIQTIDYKFSNESRSQANGPDDYVADYYGYKHKDSFSTVDFTGYYLGTFEGNTDVGGEGARVKILIDAYLDFYNLKFSTTYQADQYYKADLPDNPTGNSFTSEHLTVTWLTDENNYLKKGTWEFTESSMLQLGFYAVKGAQEYALYFVDPAQSSGNWTTAHLRTPNNKNIPEISHFSGVDAVTHTVVPEPTTLLLLGAGLLGLGFVGRRRSGR
jgi:hypothetical protein